VYVTVSVHVWCLPEHDERVACSHSRLCLCGDAVQGSTQATGALRYGEGGVDDLHNTDGCRCG
jgi:hypothetical protein